MSNLLTQERRRDIAIMRMTRASGMFLVLVTFTAMVGTLALLPAYLSLRMQASALAYDIEVLERALDVHARGSDREQVAMARQEVAVLSSLYNRTGSASGSLYAAADARRGGVALTRLQYQAAEAGLSWTLTVSGLVSGQREMLGYAEAMRSSGFFNDVTIPVSALASADEGRMTIVGTGGSN